MDYTSKSSRENNPQVDPITAVNGFLGQIGQNPSHYGFAGRQEVSTYALWIRQILAREGRRALEGIDTPEELLERYSLEKLRVALKRMSRS